MENIREIRIYIACLASYNNAILHGRWIDATLGEDHIWSETKSMLADSPMINAEEWAIHDYEGFEGVRLSEYEGFALVAELAEFIEKHGALGGELFNHYSENIEDAKAAIEDHYAGAYESLEDFAREITEETTDIPDTLRFYIDYEKMARDLEISDVLSIETNGTTHIFWSH